MTEREWLTSKDPTSLLAFLERTGSHRKLRLFACACCLRVTHLLKGKASLNAIEVALQRAEAGEPIDEMFVDEELASATEPLEIVAPEGRPYPNAPAYYATWQHAPDAATSTAQATVEAINFAGGKADLEVVAQIASIHDIFGNPFRDVAFDPAWRTQTTTEIAAKMYEGRDFRAMPILADALEEAGCDNLDILNHCREPGVHVRGCWVVDLVLRKS